MTLREFSEFEPGKNAYAFLTGKPGGSMLPYAHAQLFELSDRDAEYYEIEVRPDRLQEAFSIAAKKLKGANLESTLGKAAFELVDKTSPEAKQLKAVNTVAFKKGRISGYHTGISDFEASLKLDGVSLKDKKVLLLCGGGSSPEITYLCARDGAILTVTGRYLDKAAALQKLATTAFPGASVSVSGTRHIPRDIQIVLDSTSNVKPGNNAPLLFLPRETDYVFDSVYNPPITPTLKLAAHTPAKTRDGLFMLVMHAAHSQKIWMGAKFSDAGLKTALRKSYGRLAVQRLHEEHKKENIVLCGFMGSGKTTIGRKLAKITGLEFYDSDQYLEQREGKSVLDIFYEKGEEYFLDLEAEYVRELSGKRGIVLSLGGGSVMRPENVKAVRETGLIIYLDTPFHRIVQNLSHSYTRPIIDRHEGVQDTRKLYNSRKATYRRVSDCSVRSTRISEVLDNVLKTI